MNNNACVRLRLTDNTCVHVQLNQSTSEPSLNTSVSVKLDISVIEYPVYFEC